jgi:hypothetical protein
MNGGGEFRDAGKDTAAQALGGDIAEEALDHVQPGRRSGCEVDMGVGQVIWPPLSRFVINGVPY